MLLLIQSYIYSRPSQRIWTKSSPSIRWQEEQDCRACLLGTPLHKRQSLARFCHKLGRMQGYRKGAVSSFTVIARILEVYLHFKGIHHYKHWDISSTSRWRHSTACFILTSATARYLSCDVFAVTRRSCSSNATIHLFTSFTSSYTTVQCPIDPHTRGNSVLSCCSRTDSARTSNGSYCPP